MKTNKIILFFLTLVLCLFPHVALADEAENKHVGLQTDIGIPEGLGLGIVAKPNVSWFRLNVSATYLLGFGIRGGVTLNPIKCFVAPSLTLEAGHVFESHVPNNSSIPGFSYDYLNAHLGIEFGGQRSKFFIHGGLSSLGIATHEFAKAIDNKDKSLIISDPDATVRLFPTAKLGYLFYF